MLEESGTIEGQAFLNTWRALPQEVTHRVPVAVHDIEAVKTKLQSINLFVLAHRPVSSYVVLCWKRGKPLARAIWSAVSCQAWHHAKQKLL